MKENMFYILDLKIIDIFTGSRDTQWFHPSCAWALGFKPQQLPSSYIPSKINIDIFSLVLVDLFFGFATDSLVQLENNCYWWEV